MTTRLAFLVLVACLAQSMHAARAESLDEIAERLRAEHAGPFVEATSAELPFMVTTSRQGNRLRSRARFLLEGARFEDLVALLGEMPGWCQSLLLHLNVKSCVHDPGGERLDLYLGRKYFQHPADSVRFVFQFDREIADGVLRARLTAERGPYGTSEYVFVLGAVRVQAGVFVELTLSNEQGYADTIVDIYLNTLGRSKVGFTRDGQTIFGNPRYVGGREGAAERNVVRYMLALRISLERVDEPFMERARAWFDETERYPRQLRELNREDYLDIKRREFENQLAYQEAADSGETIVRRSPGKNR